MTQESDKDRSLGVNCAHKKKKKDMYIFGASISHLYYDETNSEALKSLADKVAKVATALKK